MTTFIRPEPIYKVCWSIETGFLTDPVPPRGVNCLAVGALRRRAVLRKDGEAVYYCTDAGGPPKPGTPCEPMFRNTGESTQHVRSRTALAVRDWPADKFGNELLLLKLDNGLDLNAVGVVAAYFDKPSGVMREYYCEVKETSHERGEVLIKARFYRPQVGDRISVRGYVVDVNVTPHRLPPRGDGDRLFLERSGLLPPYAVTFEVAKGTAVCSVVRQVGASWDESEAQGVEISVGRRYAEHEPATVGLLYRRADGSNEHEITPRWQLTPPVVAVEPNDPLAEAVRAWLLDAVGPEPAGGYQPHTVGQARRALAPHVGPADAVEWLSKLWTPSSDIAAKLRRTPGDDRR